MISVASRPVVKTVLVKWVYRALSPPSISLGLITIFECSHCAMSEVPRPKPPKIVGVEAPTLLLSSLVALRRQRFIIEHPSSLHHHPTTELWQRLMSPTVVQSLVSTWPVKPDAEPPELGGSVPAPLGLGTSEVTADFDPAVASLPEPSTDADVTERELLQ